MFDNLSTEKAYPLDIRDFKETGKKLSKAIEEAVRDTQRVIIRTLPDRLIMTAMQYDILSNKPEFMKMGDVGQEYWLYRTPLNVMEIEVK